QWSRSSMFPSQSNPAHSIGYGANRENGENRTLRGQLHRLALPIGMGTDQQIAFRTDHGELMRKGVVTVD
ncbi:hypothetical protein, partial [Pseudomonas helleri]|uniref:hypothetical protein n=2 Tax=Pseudomonas TaxID=286 RepID=UPI001E5D1F4E